MAPVKNKPKLNLTVREEQRNKLEQMASLENRSVSNLIEVMADERWKRLVEQQGVAYAKTVAEAMNLKLDADNPADREKLRRAVLDLVAGRKMRKINNSAQFSLGDRNFCQDEPAENQTKTKKQESHEPNDDCTATLRGSACSPKL